jgi:hypothetical protein
MRSLVLVPLVMVGLTLAATPAGGQPPDQVSIEVRGVPPGSAVQLVFDSANGSKALEGGSGSVASDFISQGKTATAFIDTCKGKVSVNVVEDGDRLLPPPDEPDCDRVTIPGVRLMPGTRLTIDVAKGVVLTQSVGTVSSSTPAATSGNGTTIGTRADVQAAARAVFDALQTEPATAVATGTTNALVVELRTISDAALGTWIPRFQDAFGAMGRQGADNATFAAMEQLLTVVVPLYRNRLTGSSGDATASTTPPSAPAAQEIIINLSTDLASEFENRTPQFGSSTAGSQFSLSGRVLDPGLTPRYRWQYSVSTGRAIGESDADASGVGSVVIADPSWDDWIEVRPLTGRTRINVRNSRPGSRAMVELMGTVGGILPDFVQQGLRFGRRATTAPPTPGPVVVGALAGARVGFDQGQVSVATASANTELRNSAGPPQLLLAARGFVDALRQMLQPTVRTSAFKSPGGVRLVIDPRGRREYWIDPMRSNVAEAQASADIPRPSLKIFIRSLGRSTGENAQEAIVINDGNVPVRILDGEEFATEPLDGVSEQALARELERYAGRPRMTMNLTSYCLNFRKAAPTKGRIYRVAGTAAQDQLAPVRRVLHAAERLRDGKALNPDSDPELYYHSIRQWAIWTVEQRFNERTFAEALIEHTKKNVTAAGRRWDNALETSARSIIPNRWRDVQQVLAEARRITPALAQ